MSHNTWLLRDILIVVALAFNAGALVWTFKNHIASLKKDVGEIKETCLRHGEQLHDLGQRIARLEGRVNTYYEGE